MPETLLVWLLSGCTVSEPPSEVPTAIEPIADDLFVGPPQPPPPAPVIAAPEPVRASAPPAPPPPPVVVVAAPEPVSAPAPLPAPRGAFLDLVLNGVAHDPIPVYLDGEDALVRSSDLAATGLRIPAGVALDVGGVSYVSLGSLSEDLTFAVDEAGLQIHVTADPTLLPRTAVDLGQSGPPPGIVYTQDTSAFLNYGVRTIDVENVDGSGEIGATIRNFRVYSAATFPYAVDPVRGLTNVTLDLRERKLQIIGGDAVANGGVLGGGATIGGVQLARSFSLDPYFVPGPSFDHQATVMTPSTLEVYVNGQLTHREEVAPGPLDVANIPATAGAGDTRIVLRDAFGREQVVSASYYRPTALLAPGRQEYSYTAGSQRYGLGLESFDYREAAALGVHRVGLTRNLTAGLRGEVAPDRVSGGTSVTAGIVVGQIEIAGAGSAATEGPGGAASLAYSLVSRRAGASLFARAQSPAYATLSLLPEADRAVVDAGASFSVPVSSRGSVSVSAAWAEMRDLGPTGRATLSGNARLPEELQATLLGTVLVAEGTAPAWAVNLGLLRTFGRRAVATAHTEANQAGEVASGEVSASLPSGPGIGYRAGGASGTTDQAYGIVDGQAKFGRANASYTWTPDASSGIAGVAGGLVWIGGRAFASRPVDSSYALVRVPGVRGVEVTLNNNPIGRTNRHGDVIVPGLLPYYGNRMGIAQDDVPIDRALDAREQVVAPPARSGALVVFPAAQLRAARGHLAVSGGDPAFGEVEVGGLTSPIGRSGGFELADLPAGTWSLVARYPGGRCTGSVTVPADGPEIVDLGLVPCGSPP